MTDDVMDVLSHRYLRVTRVGGAEPRDCVLLMHRSQWTDFANDESTESLVVRVDRDGIRVIAEGEGAARDLWVSPSGRVYVVGRFEDVDGLHVGTPDGSSYRWSRIDLPGFGGRSRVQGVWGLDDDFIFAWGGGAFIVPGDDLTSERALRDPPVCAHFDGAAWRSVDAPGAISAVHGSSKEHVVAVGCGLVARWQWGRWERMESPIAGSFSFVRVDGEDALAATFQGELYEGTPHGWRLLTRCERNVWGLASWEGQMIVATRPDGLLRVAGDTVEPLVESFNASCLHAGRALFWCSTSGLLGTRDFKTFEEVRDTELGAALGGEYWAE